LNSLIRKFKEGELVKITARLYRQKPVTPVKDTYAGVPEYFFFDVDEVEIHSQTVLNNCLSKSMFMAVPQPPRIRSFQLSIVEYAIQASRRNNEAFKSTCHVGADDYQLRVRL